MDVLTQWKESFQMCHYIKSWHYILSISYHFISQLYLNKAGKQNVMENWWFWRTCFIFTPNFIILFPWRKSWPYFCFCPLSGLVTVFLSKQALLLKCLISFKTITDAVLFRHLTMAKCSGHKARQMAQQATFYFCFSLTKASNIELHVPIFIIKDMKKYFRQLWNMFESMESFLIIWR